MSNNIHYQTHPQQPLTNQYNYQPQHYSYHHRHHHHHHHQQPPPPSLTSPVGAISNISSYLNQPLPIIQSSAYFLDRIDLDNYTNHTLKQTVETILSKTKSKGLKVKISLPDDGLIIDNTTDANQSWIFKTSELLYFWREPLYLNIIVVVTINRSHTHSNRPYSASIFRLRGNESAQLFLHQAQKFFSNLTTLSKSVRNPSVEKLLHHDAHRSDSKSSTLKSKTKSSSKLNEQYSTSNNNHSSGIRRVTRAEFDPGKSPSVVDVLPNHHRTVSETTSSTDSHFTNSAREIVSYTRKTAHQNEDDDDKLTTISNNLSLDQVMELMRELKELRNEIAALKLERKMPIPTRSISTSPLVMPSEMIKQTNDSSTTTSSPSFPEITSQSEVDAETQTDFSLISHRRKQIGQKNKKTMIGSSGIISLVETKSSPVRTRNGRRTISNSSTTTISDQEETSSDLPSQITDSSMEKTSIQYQPIILSAPPRPILFKNPNTFVSITPSISLNQSNSTEEGLVSLAKPSSNSESGGANSIAPAEHIYENIPILIQPTANREAIYNIPIIKADEHQSLPSNDYVYYTINNPSESQQKSSNSPPTTDTNPPELPSPVIQQQKPQIVSTGRHRNQPIYFANHLTNPIFNIDKQLLINTIANQFGVDLNSPQLQQLITNQHLFVARKRTFANMVWQMTPDEETALYTPLGNSQKINIDSMDSKNSAARSILKAAKNLSSKRRSITWDNTLE